MLLNLINDTQIRLKSRHQLQFWAKRLGSGWSVSSYLKVTNLLAVFRSLHSTIIIYKCRHSCLLSQHFGFIDFSFLVFMSIAKTCRLIAQTLVRECTVINKIHFWTWYTFDQNDTLKKNSFHYTVWGKKDTWIYQEYTVLDKSIPWNIVLPKLFYLYINDDTVKSSGLMGFC